MVRRLATAARFSGCLFFALSAASFDTAGAGEPSAPLERTPYQTYATANGLTSLAGGCLAQDRAGMLLACSEHGVFAYDGERFTNLGPDQGLRDGGTVSDVVNLPDGRVVIAFSNDVLISGRAPDAVHPLTSLRFLPVQHPGIVLFNEHRHRLAPWGNGLVLLTEDSTVRVVIPPIGPAHVETMRYDAAERAMLADARSLFMIRGHLWETFDDGRICSADPGNVTCYGAAEGLRGGPWVDLIAGPGQTLLARSPSSVASFNPARGGWSVTDLPDQGEMNVTYGNDLTLFVAPDGDLMTQADHGLLVRSGADWRLMTVAQGAPAGTVTSAMTDANGQLWFQIFGRGLARWVGFGHWQTLRQADGLSEGIPWETARLPDGTLWITTDTAVDEIVRGGSGLDVSKTVPGASFSMAAGPHGRLWADDGPNGLKIINPSDGSDVVVKMPSVHVIRPDARGAMWLGTRRGLFRVDALAGGTPRPVLAGSVDERVFDICPDGTGGLFYIAGRNLHHRRSDGIDRLVNGAWSDRSFDARALALGHDRTLWVGGLDGLIHLTIDGDRVTAARAVPVADTQTNSIPALMIDHRGWVWVGSSSGVSVFDGRRWASINTENGLVSNDVSEGGLREDPDGSIWIATSGGVSHLLDPSWVFASARPEMLVTQARLGAHKLPDTLAPYTKAPLSFEFGNSNFSAEQSVIFRYRLSGVDQDWQTSVSGDVKYASVPPGRHVLTVLAENELTHRSSEPVTLVVDMGYPWWRQWWSETLWLLLGSVAVYLAMRLRFRTMYARQAELTRRVAEATRELSEAKARAEHQAAHDQLTSLLTRREVERRLEESLARVQGGGDIVVALVDADHFKKINDDYGHLGGDDVLRGLSRLVSRAIRDEEYAGRYGGEEILAVLDDRDGRAAERVLDLHRAIRHELFKADGAPIRVTCSIGVAWAVAGDNWESLIRRADRALYQAKREGRDRVVEAPGPEIIQLPRGGISDGSR